MHSQYQREIYQTLRENELKCTVQFFYQSPQIRYRHQFIAVLNALSDHLELNNPATHLAALLVDRFMDQHDIPLIRLDLLIAVCVMIAAKVELTDAQVPCVSQLYKMLRRRHTTKDIVDLERTVVKFFDWSLMLPTAAHFTELLLPAAVTAADIENQCDDPRRLQHLQTECQNLVVRFLRTTLFEVHTHDFLPSLVAASCLLAARSALRLRDVWPRRLMRKTSYSIAEVQKCLIGILPHPRKRRCDLSGSPDGGYESGIERSPNAKRFHRGISPSV